MTGNQTSCVTRLYETDQTIVVAAMGFGKTVVTLTAINELLRDNVLVRVLIIAPLKVARTVWQQEAAKWSHTSEPLALAVGTDKTRRAAFESDARIVVTNYENIPWAAKAGLLEGFDGIVYDELSKLKKAGGRTFKAIRKCLHGFKWRVGLTGTPVSEDFQGLYGQVLMIDGGKRLGTRFDRFRHAHFVSYDPGGFIWEMIDPKGVRLLDSIKDLIFIADNDAYKKSLPSITRAVVSYELPREGRLAYNEMKKTAVLEMGDETFTAANAAVLTGKLQQISSGFLYREDDAPVDLHRARFLALRKLLSRIPAGENVLIAYWYKHELETLLYGLAGAVAMTGTGDEKVMADWNAGRIKILLVQPRSCGHGIQLQHGGSTLVWYGPVWSRDLTEQTEARLWRQGQKKPVNVYTLAGSKTIDELIIAKVESKGGYQELLTAHLS